MKSLPGAATAKNESPESALLHYSFMTPASGGGDTTPEFFFADCEKKRWRYIVYTYVLHTGCPEKTATTVFGHK